MCMCAFARCTVLSLTHSGCAERAVAFALPPAAIVSLPIARFDQLEIYCTLFYFILFVSIRSVCVIALEQEAGNKPAVC
jgi:hypothetical protein